MPSDVLVHPVETLVQAKVHRLTLVASLNAVSVARRWEGATDDLFEHSLPEIGTCCATEKSGKVAPQAWHHLLGCSLEESNEKILVGCTWRSREPLAVMSIHALHSDSRKKRYEDRQSSSRLFILYTWESYMEIV